MKDNLKLTNKSEEYQIKAMKFAVDYCKNVYIKG